MNKPLWIKRIGSLGIALLVLFFCLAPALGMEVPALKGRVNDYAGILSPAAESRLETVLREQVKITYAFYCDEKISVSCGIIS